jgi:hypothetical protein
MEIEVTGFEELSKRLGNAEQLLQPLAIQVVAGAVTEIKKQFLPYPPQPSRTRAKSFNTYVRGVGQYPRSSFVAAQSAPGGFKVKPTRKASVRYTSEQMDDKFTTSVQPGNGEIIGNVHNSASYSGWVIGEKDDQRPYHAETGWVDEEKALMLAMPIILADYVDRAADAFIKYFEGT